MNVGIPFWLLMVALLVGLLFAALLYVRNKRQPYPKWLKMLLFGFRTLSVGILILLIFNPFISQKSKVEQKPIIVLAHDNSASILLGQDSSFDVRQYLQNFAQLKQTISEDYQLDEYAFGEKVRETDSLDFRDEATDLSQMLSDLERKYYKKNVGAVLLFSDGVYNRGFAPELLAENFPFPIYAVVVGDTTAASDLMVKDVFYNKTAAVKTMVPIKVVLSAQDCKGCIADVALWVDDELVENQKVEIHSNRFSKDVDFMLSFEKAGVKKMEVRLSGVAGETQLLNNSRVFFIDVTDQQYKVLFVAKAPHPDLTALRSALSEQNKVDFVFVNKDPLPDLAAYDMIVLHQLPASSMDCSALENQLKDNPKIPLMMVVGPYSDIRKLNDFQSVFDIKQGASSAILEGRALLNSSFGVYTLNPQLKNEITKFPPLALPHLEISALRSHDDLLLQQIVGVNTGNPMLSFATDANGRKMVFLFGTDVWRWRLYDFYQRNNHDLFEDVFAKALRYLLQNADDASRIYCKEEFLSNEPVSISAELLNPSGELITDPELSIQIVNKASEEAYDYVFSKKEHSYELNVGILPVGFYYYKVSYELSGKVFSAQGNFAVVASGIESRQLTADYERMQALANATDGMCFTLDSLSLLPSALRDNQRIVSQMREETRFEELIHFKLLFFVLLALLSAEWVLRKMFGAY